MKHIDAQARIPPPAWVGVVAMLVKGLPQILRDSHFEMELGCSEQVVPAKNLRKYHGRLSSPHSWCMGVKTLYVVGYPGLQG